MIYQEIVTELKQATQWILWTYVILHIDYVAGKIVIVSLLWHTTSHIHVTQFQ